MSDACLSKTLNARHCLNQAGLAVEMASAAKLEKERDELLVLAAEWLKLGNELAESNH